MLPPPSSSSTVNRHVRYRCNGIRFCRPRCCQLKTTLSLPLTNRSVCDPRQRPRTSWWSPLLLPPYTHMVRGLLFLWRRIFLVAHTPTSWWEEGMEASSWQEIWRWSSCQLKHVPDFPSILLASMPWWRWKYVVAVVNFLVFTSYHLSLFCINLQKIFCFECMLFCYWRLWWIFVSVRCAFFVDYNLNIIIYLRRLRGYQILMYISQT